MRHAFLIAALSSTACAARTEIAGIVATDASTADAPAQTSALVFNSCAPNDGPEVVYEFGSAGSCAALPDTSTVDRIFFDSSFPTDVGNYAIGGGTSGGFVCTNASCTEATGVLTITEISASSVSGSYHLVSTPLGTVHDGAFTAVVCHNVALCG